MSTSACEMALLDAMDSTLSQARLFTHVMWRRKILRLYFLCCKTNSSACEMALPWIQFFDKLRVFDWPFSFGRFYF